MKALQKGFLKKSKKKFSSLLSHNRKFLWWHKSTKSQNIKTIKTQMRQKVPKDLTAVCEILSKMRNREATRLYCRPLHFP